MKMRSITLAMAAMILGLCGTVACGTSGSTAFANGATADDRDLVGTWEFQGGEGSAEQKITLTLRRDHSYTKTLEASVNGVPYGGTHSGTWNADGMNVRLSGDGNWPPYTHNLSSFHRVR